MNKGSGELKLSINEEDQPVKPLWSIADEEMAQVDIARSLWGNFYPVYQIHLLSMSNFPYDPLLLFQWETAYLQISDIQGPFHFLFTYIQGNSDVPVAIDDIRLKHGMCENLPGIFMIIQLYIQWYLEA